MKYEGGKSNLEIEGFFKNNYKEKDSPEARKYEVQHIFELIDKVTKTIKEKDLSKSEFFGEDIIFKQNLSNIISILTELGEKIGKSREEISKIVTVNCELTHELGNYLGVLGNFQAIEKFSQKRVSYDNLLDMANYLKNASGNFFDFLNKINQDPERLKEAISREKDFQKAA